MQGSRVLTLILTASHFGEKPPDLAGGAGMPWHGCGPASDPGVYGPESQSRDSGNSDPVPLPSGPHAEPMIYLLPCLVGPVDRPEDRSGKSLKESEKHAGVAHSSQPILNKQEWSVGWLQALSGQWMCVVLLLEVSDV